jgi:DNA-binding LacI/PurR family transcriptional regulator
VEPRPTLETVAQQAAVSRQTVSNVLNAPHLVRPETLERVRAVIAEVGYRPHGAARQLRTRRSRVIGLRMERSVDGINGAVLDRFLHALTEQAQLRGYRVMLFTAPDDEGEITQYRELLDVLEIDAFVLTSTHHGDPRTRWLTDNQIPFVTFGRPWDEPDSPTAQPDHAWVDVDGAAGTRAAVEHLQQLGHRDIAFVGWPAGSGVGDDRRAGWARAMQAAGTGQDRLDALDVATPDGVTEGARAARRLLDLVGPTAFVCASDSLALGVLGALRAGDGGPTPHGAAAVVGFDDTPVARAVGLSSVAQPLTEAAGRTLDLLLAHLAGTTPPDHHVLLAPSLVARESSTTHPR